MRLLAKSEGLRVDGRTLEQVRPLSHSHKTSADLLRVFDTPCARRRSRSAERV